MDNTPRPRRRDRADHGGLLPARTHGPVTDNPAHVTVKVNVMPALPYRDGQDAVWHTWERRTCGS